MLHKFSFGVLCAIGLAFFSCSGNGEKKNEALLVPTNNTIIEAQMPLSDDLMILEKKLEKDSSNNEIRSMLAANYYTAGLLEKAAFHFTKVYENDNKNVVALSNLGNIYYDSQQDDKAIQFYEKALEIDAKNINMRTDLATCYGNINKLKKAIAILKENIEMDKNHAQSHHNLSVILQKKGDVKEADEEMKIYNEIKAAGK